MKVIVSRFLSLYNLFNSLGNYAVTLDTPRAEGEGEKEQTVDELRKCRRVLHVRVSLPAHFLPSNHVRIADTRAASIFTAKE